MPGADAAPDHRAPRTPAVVAEISQSHRDVGSRNPADSIRAQTRAACTTPSSARCCRPERPSSSYAASPGPLPVRPALRLPLAEHTTTRDCEERELTARDYS